MSWPADTLAGIYLFLFAFGLIFSVVSLLLGAGHDHFHLPADTHVGHGHLSGNTPGTHSAHGAPSTHAAGPGAGGELGSSGIPTPSPINISTVMIFLTWFGAAGYVLRVYYGAATALSLLVAVGLGLAGATIVYLFLAKLLWRGQTELNPANYAIAGTPARVSSPIRAGGTGEIVYTLDNKRRVDGARSVDGSSLLLGAEVIVARYEGGIAYVEPWVSGRAGDPFIGQPIDPVTHPPPR